MSNEETLVGERLNALLKEADLELVDLATAERFGEYLTLLQRWNARLNLTAVRDQEGILSRHFLESIACARTLPLDITTVLDFGSGAGFPGVPIALCRPDLRVTLAESQGKKAAFLNEAIRTLDLTRTKVHSGRAETLGSLFDCVTLRAVDQMQLAMKSAAALVSPGGWLAPMTTGTELSAMQAVAGECFTWNIPMPLPGGADRIVVLGRRRAS